MAKNSKKKITNGVPPLLLKPEPKPEPVLSYRDLKFEMEDEIRVFKDYLVAKYTDFHGRDMRRDVSWYLEQMGLSIHSDLERVKREERAKIAAENMAAEAQEEK